PSGREVQTIPLGYRGQVRQVVISPDGSKIVWVDGNGAVNGLGPTVMIPFPVIDDPFDHRKFKGAESVALAFSRDGKYVAIAARGGLMTVDVAEKKTVFSGQVGDVHRCVFSPDGKSVALLHAVKGLRLVNVAADAKPKGKVSAFSANLVSPMS